MDDWLRSLPPALLELARSPNQTLSRGGSHREIDVTLTVGDPPNHSVLGFSVARLSSAAKWLFTSKQCGLLEACTTLRYTCQSGALTSSGRLFLTILLGMCPNIHTIRVDSSALFGQPIIDCLAANRSITVFGAEFDIGLASTSCTALANILQRNEVITNASFWLDDEAGPFSVYGNDYNLNCPEAILKCVKEQALRGAPLSGDVSLQQEWVAIRMYQNWLNTRKRLAAFVFAMEEIGAPVPIAAAILRGAFGGESVGVHQLKFDMGRVLPEPEPGLQNTDGGAASHPQAGSQSPPIRKRTLAHDDSSADGEPVLKVARR